MCCHVGVYWFKFKQHTYAQLCLNYWGDCLPGHMETCHDSVHQRSCCTRYQELQGWLEPECNNNILYYLFISSTGWCNSSYALIRIWNKSCYHVPTFIDQFELLLHNSGQLIRVYVRVNNNILWLKVYY